MNQSLMGTGNTAYGGARQAQSGRGFSNTLSPQQIQAMELNSNLGYEALPQLQGMLSPQQAAQRFGQEQQRGEQWSLNRFQDAQGRFDSLAPGIDEAMGRLTQQSDRGLVTDELLQNLYNRQAGVIEGESQRNQARMQEGLSNRGLSGSGQGLGAIAGIGRNRSQALTSAKRDVDIWGAMENLKGRERASSSLNQLLALRANITKQRSDLDMSLRMSPSDYSGFTKTPMVGMSGGGGGRPVIKDGEGRTTSQRMGGGGRPGGGDPPVNPPQNVFADKSGGGGGAGGDLFGQFGRSGLTGDGNGAVAPWEAAYQEPDQGNPVVYKPGNPGYNG